MRAFVLFAIAAFVIVSCKQTKYDKNGEPIRLGRFRLRTFPKGAKVWIDGKLEIVSTPATIVKNEGRYHLKIQAPGAEAVERTITIDAGESDELTLRIPAAPPATVTVWSDVPGAIVRINGYKRGETPLYRVITKPGPIDVTVVGPNNRAKSVRDTLRRSENKTLEVFFQAVASEDVEGPLESRLVVPMSMPEARGKLSLGLKPNGVVETDDGTLIGETPLENHPMKPGRHTVWLRSKNGRYERRVTLEIDADKPAVYRFLLRSADEVPGWKPDAGVSGLRPPASP